MSEIATVENNILTRMSGLSSQDLNIITGVDSSTLEGKAALFEALNTDVRLADHLNEEFDLANFIAQLVEVADENTGELGSAVRVVLITAGGEAYTATSQGVLSSLKTIVAIFGEPSSWEAPISVRAVERRSRNGARRYMTLELAK